MTRRPIDTEGNMQKNSARKKEVQELRRQGLIKNGDKKMKCQRCGGTGFNRNQPRSTRFGQRACHAPRMRGIQ